MILVSSGSDIDDADLTANSTEQQSTSQTPPIEDDLTETESMIMSHALEISVYTNDDENSERYIN